MEWADWTSIDQVEIVPPFLIDADFKIEDKVLGLAKPYLYRLYVTLIKDWPGHDSNEQQFRSLVALIATTENLTAMNLRKKLILDGSVSPEEEIHVLDVLLSSPLHKHTKSPLLWEHRRWLFETTQLHRSIPHELSIIAAAARHHPKNYYAWTYARRLVNADTRDQIAAWTWDLCKQNLSDTSMWSFLGATGLEYQPAARALNTEYPHDAITAYLNNQPS